MAWQDQCREKLITAEQAAEVSGRAAGRGAQEILAMKEGQRQTEVW